MASAAAAASCFSTTTITTPHYLSSKLGSSTDAISLRAACPRACRMLSLGYIKESCFVPVTSLPRRFLRTSAAVAEEATASVEEEEVKEVEEVVEEEEVKEVEEEGEEEEVVVVATAAPQKTKLYFGNLPYNCDSAQLAGIIQEYANPEMVEVLYDRETGRSRGFAFVTMSTVEECEIVIDNLDGSQFGGRTMKVNFSDKPKAKVPLYPETEFKLFIGNLSWTVTSEMLTEKFQEYGDVAGARVLYDGDTGRSRGYGFVCYSTKEEMDNALQTLNGEELEGRPMRISLALGRRS